MFSSSSNLIFGHLFKKSHYSDMLDGDFLRPVFAIFGPCLFWPNGSMDQDAT